jgi:hypothetical protein
MAISDKMAAANKMATSKPPKLLYINKRKPTRKVSNRTFNPETVYPAHTAPREDLDAYLSMADFQRALNDKEYAEQILNLL